MGRPCWGQDASDSSWDPVKPSSGLQVHPELYMASFECPQCQNKIPNVEQQFKYTQPVICNGNNNTCGNRWARLRRMCSHSFQLPSAASYDHAPETAAVTEGKMLNSGL